MTTKAGVALVPEQLARSGRGRGREDDLSRVQQLQAPQDKQVSQNITTSFFMSTS